MGGRCQHEVDRALLDHLRVFHHQDLVRHGADHRHVVGDEHIGQTALQLQSLQQAQHLFLHRHIQGTGGLVEHQELRAHNQSARDGQALALATREGVWVTRQQKLSLCCLVGQAHVTQGLQHLGAALRCTQLGPVHAQALAHDLFHRHAR